MPKKEFRIIASTGENFYEFFYIIQMPAGDFYYGGVGVNRSRTSIHASGTVNMHYSNGEKIILPPNEKLKSLKGLRQLCGMTIGNAVFQNSSFSKPPRKGKVDGLIYFDIRKFKSSVGLMLFLLEPYQYSCLEVLHKIIKNPHFNIITETNPWLVVAVYDSHRDT